MNLERFVEQSKQYQGSAARYAVHYDQYDEQHVIIEMRDVGYVFWLDWIGGEYAAEPDEFDVVPFDNLHWETVQ